MEEIKEIKNGKLQIKKIFEDWYTVPAYQRHYVWEADNVSELLIDFKNGVTEHPNEEYFLGSYIFQSKGEGNDKDLLDGQQRITTLFLLFAYLRDKYGIETVQKYIYQEEDIYEEKPAKVRLQYEIRGDVKRFINDKIVKKGILNDDKVWEEIEHNANRKDINSSICHICSTLMACHKFFNENLDLDIQNYLRYILNRVVMIYISANTLEDAFRLFSIMNDRGLKLSNADILKSSNLESIPDEKERTNYAREWEDIQEDLGDEFDRFLSYIRTMLVMSRAKLNLLDEFEKEIFNKGILKKGSAFFNKVIDAYKIYNKAIELENCNDIEYLNLINVMKKTYVSTDWIPVIMYYYGKFETNGLCLFTQKMIHKNIADMVCGYAPTTRIENLNAIMKKIKSTDNSTEILTDPDIFKIDKEKFIGNISLDVYGRQYTKTLLMLLELKYLNKDATQPFGITNIEHILPQNPSIGSNWLNYYSEEERLCYTHKIGNLCLISRRKNTSLGNKDYLEKKDGYFKGSIDVFARTLQIINSHDSWLPIDIKENQKKTIADIEDLFEIEE